MAPDYRPATPSSFAPMPKPVFISYARSASQADAKTLHDLLGGEEGSAFLDQADIEIGDEFPSAIGRALLDARVVVVFATSEYFRRWYCLRELAIALLPATTLVEQAPSVDARSVIVDHLVVIIQEGDVTDVLTHLPPALRVRSWPNTRDLPAAAELIRRRLASPSLPLGQRVADSGRNRLEVLTQTAVVPRPRPLDSTIAPLAVRPTLGDRFVGRAHDLWILDSLLESAASDGPRRVFVEGLGGSGKTRLVIEYVHRLAPVRFPGGIFWLEADGGKDGVATQLLTVWPSSSTGGALQAGMRADDWNLYRRVEGDLTARLALGRILVVLNDVSDPDAHGELADVSQLCPTSWPVTLLVTCRSRHSLRHRGASSLALQPLDAAAATLLLTEGTSTSFPREEAVAIAAWVGFLPLALDLLNALLRTGALTRQELLDQVSTASPVDVIDARLEALRPLLPHDALPAIAATFRATCERLPDTARTIATRLAYLAPTPIPMEILQRLVAPEDLATVRATLVARSVLSGSHHSDTVDVLGSIHGVLAAYLRSSDPSPSESLEACSTVFTERQDPRDRCWRTEALLVPHAIALWGHLRAPRALTAESGLTALALARTLTGLGVWAGAATLLGEAFLAARRDLAPRHPVVVALAQQLGVCAAQLNDNVLAESLLTEVVAVLREAALFVEGLGDMLLNSEGALAQVFAQRGWTDRAEALLRHGLSGARSAPDVRPHTVAAAQVSLAVLLMGRGREDAAEALANSALAMVGRSDPEPGFKARLVIAGVLWSKGDRTAATREMEALLQDELRELGPDHPTTLQTLSNLSAMTADQGDTKRAREYCKWALEGRERVFGNEHPLTLNTLSHLARVIRSESPEDAERLLRRVYDARVRIEGAVHPSTLVVATNLGMLQAERGNREGVELLRTTLALSLSAYGSRHPKTTQAAWVLLLSSAAMAVHEAREEALRALTWLTHAEPRELSASQTKILDDLKAIFGHA